MNRTRDAVHTALAAAHPGRQPGSEQFVRQNSAALRIIPEFHEVIAVVCAPHEMRLGASAHATDLFNRKRHRQLLLATRSGFEHGKPFKMGTESIELFKHLWARLAHREMGIDRIG
jgi:hypothetical protein